MGVSERERNMSQQPQQQAPYLSLLPKVQPQQYPQAPWSMVSSSSQPLERTSGMIQQQPIAQSRRIGFRVVIGVLIGLIYIVVGLWLWSTFTRFGISFGGLELIGFLLSLVIGGFVYWFICRVLDAHVAATDFRTSTFAKQRVQPHEENIPLQDVSSYPEFTDDSPYLRL